MKLRRVPACSVGLALFLSAAANPALATAWTDLQSWVMTHSPGDKVTNGELIDRDGNDWTQSVGNSGGKFLWSNNPENVLSGDVDKGLAYMLVTASTTTAFSVALHHKNGTGAPRSFRVVVRNHVQGTTAHVELTKGAHGTADMLDPDPDKRKPVLAGKRCVKNWFDGGNVDPTSQDLAYNEKLETLVTGGDLGGNWVANAMYNFTTNSSVKVYVVVGTISDYASISFASRTGTQVRGTGTNWTRTLAATSAPLNPCDLSESNETRLQYGTLDTWPYWQFLTDETDGTTNIKFYGDYNVEYTVTITAAKSGCSNAKYANLINPRGGAYGGATRIAITTTLPSDPDGLLSPSSDGAIVYKEATACPTSTVFKFMLPGGAAAPVDFVLVAYEY